jgi:hypothetical protein
MPELFGVRYAAVLQSILLAVASLTAVVVTAAPADAHHGVTRWDCLAHYESSHRWHINTGNGHYGGLQFALPTWRYYGGPNFSGNTYPNHATRGEQIRIAKRVAFWGWRHRAAQGGASAWPHTWPLCG